MKKFFLVFISIFLLFIPVSYAEEFDTNIVSKNQNPAGEVIDLYKSWAYYNTTGTRYVIRVYDWNTEKYIAVPKEYYINHVYGYKSSGSIDTDKQIMYLGVDKTKEGKYEVVKSGSTIFTDNTYSHVIKWFDNSEVNNFGLTKNDVNLLAGIVKEEALEKGNVALANNMQNVIDGTVPFDVRAEILFLLKVPGTDGAAQVGTVSGKNSIESYNFVFYNNKANSETPSSEWRKEYITYLEVKAIAYKWEEDRGLKLKSYWLDKVACALYEKHDQYVFVNDVYQCSCDLYKRRYGTSTSYWLENNKLNLNYPAYNPDNKGDKWYRYYTPGRCGIPVVLSGKTYFITPGQTYSNLDGNNVTIDNYVKYSDSISGIMAHEEEYLDIVSNDPTKATIYEGWDYITSNLASTLVIACDKDTGNTITLNGVTYSEFENVSEGTYNKEAWEIEGYEYLGYLVKDDFSAPSVPVGISNTTNNVDIIMTSDDVENGAKRQVIFVYQKSKEVKEYEARISIYQIEDDVNSVMYTGKFIIDKDGVLEISLYDETGNEKHVETIEYDVENGYEINTNVIENVLGIDKEKFLYAGNLIKVHDEYFLAYLGEELTLSSGSIYNLKDLGENKVHIILGYNVLEEIEGAPELKISYIDDKGNLIPGKDPKITIEEIGIDIFSKAEDLRENLYMYVGYTYMDSQESFSDIVSPLTILGSGDEIITNFENAKDRRHIAFVYKKIELKFEIDIEMNPNDMNNQLIGQKVNEDYWVIDEGGKVILKVAVSGDEGLNILNYSVKLRIPFDTYMDGGYAASNSVNNLTVNDLSEIIVAEKLVVPAWVEEKEYNIDAVIEANVEGFGIVSANKKDNVEIVGKLYDFTITNLDGSDVTGDKKWKETLFASEDLEYKASNIPIGQKENQPENYYYGIKLGTTFYFSVNTKGIKNNSISIQPKFLYVTEDGQTIQEVDVYFNDNGKMKNLLSEGLDTRYMKINESNVLKPNVMLEVKKAQEISEVFLRYKYSVTENRSVGTLSKIGISKYLSLPYLNYINEFKNLYGENALELALKTENELLTYASHWYGKYVIPSSAKVVNKGAGVNSSGYEDGYLIVLFKIISLDGDGKEYLAYELPSDLSMWQQESLNQIIDLPMINVNDNTEKEIVIDTLNDGYAPAIIYQVGASTKDNNTSVGTH